MLYPLAFEHDTATASANDLLPPTINRFGSNWNPPGMATRDDLISRHNPAHRRSGPKRSPYETRNVTVQCNSGWEPIVSAGIGTVRAVLYVATGAYTFSLVRT